MQSRRPELDCLRDWSADEILAVNTSDIVEKESSASSRRNQQQRNQRRNERRQDPRRAEAAADAAAGSSTDSPSAAKRKEQPEQSPASATMQPRRWHWPPGSRLEPSECGRQPAECNAPCS